MQRIYSAQRNSRVDQIPRIRMSVSGKRFGIQIRTATTKMRVPVRRISFIQQTEEGKTLSCELFFYITGKAMIVKSLEWARTGAKDANRKEIPADSDACDLVVGTLKDIAQRHKVSSIYASTEDVQSILLIMLGFTAVDSQNFMQLDVSSIEQKR